MLGNPILSLILLSLFSSGAFAQFGKGSKSDALKIKQSLLVVLLEEGESPYNTAITYAMKTYWTYSAYKLIYPRELFEYCKDGYVIMAKYSVAQNPRKSYLAIVYPDKKKCEWDNLEMQAYAFTSFQPENIGAHSIRSVQLIQHYLNSVVEENTGGGFQSICRKCNENKGLIKKNILYISGSEMNDGIADEELIQKYYDHQYKIVTLDDINLAIYGQQDKYIYTLVAMEPTGDFYCLALSAKDSRIVYCDHIKYAEGFSIGFRKGHFAAMSK